MELNARGNIKKKQINNEENQNVLDPLSNEKSSASGQDSATSNESCS